MIFLLLLCGLGFGYLVGYTYGWHSANGNTEATKPCGPDKIFK